MKTYEEYLEQYDWILKRLGKGRKRLLLMSLMFIVGMNLLIATTLFELPTIIIRFVIAIALIALLLSLIISLRLRYWRDGIILVFVLLIPIVIEFFIVGFTLLYNSEKFLILFLVTASVLFSLLLEFHRSQQDIVKRMNLAQFKRYLDENEWMLDWDDARKWSFLKIEEETAAKHNHRVKWLRRLEKLHYLIPGIMVSFRRAFGNEDVIIGVLSITLGLIFASVIMLALPYYLKVYPKIREWEKEKGKPILLRFAWEEEQRQRN